MSVFILFTLWEIERKTQMFLVKTKASNKLVLPVITRTNCESVC